MTSSIGSYFILDTLSGITLRGNRVILLPFTLYLMHSNYAIINYLVFEIKNDLNKKNI